MSEAARHTPPRRFSWLFAALIAVLALAGYLAYLYVPQMIRRTEVERVLDETAATFTGKSSRLLAERDLLEDLRREMIAGIQAAGVEDPRAEYWIEVDGDDRVRFGVLYSDWLDLPLLAARETVRELEVDCSRPERGASWTCERRDLQDEHEPAR